MGRPSPEGLGRRPTATEVAAAALVGQQESAPTRSAPMGEDRRSSASCASSPRSAPDDSAAPGTASTRSSEEVLDWTLEASEVLEWSEGGRDRPLCSDLRSPYTPGYASRPPRRQRSSGSHRSSRTSRRSRSPTLCSPSQRDTHRAFVSRCCDSHRAHSAHSRSCDDDSDRSCRPYVEPLFEHRRLVGEFAARSGRDPHGTSCTAFGLEQHSRRIIDVRPQPRRRLKHDGSWRRYALT